MDNFRGLNAPIHNTVFYEEMNRYAVDKRPLGLFLSSTCHAVALYDQRGLFCPLKLTFIGEKGLKFYAVGDHLCADYLDEVIPYTTHWFTKHLKNKWDTVDHSDSKRFW